MSSDLKRLKRIGWAVRGVFVLGIAASLAGNVLHAEHDAISQAISAWSPLALLLTVELISRVPVRKGSAAYIRLAATAVIAGIAAWVSYWHMAGVASHYGETGASPFLLPFSVDGLIVVASISMVEIGGRVRALAEPIAIPVAIAAPVPPALDEPAPETVAAKRVMPRPASADKVAKAAAKLPGATVSQIAEKAGVSPSTARRHLAALRVTDASPTEQRAAGKPLLTAA
jgi:DNA-binding transcriptional ArsR family regulator